MTRLVSGEPQALESDRAMRPQTLAEFVGQEQAKGNLKVFIDAARRRGEALDHVLLFGPPGLGKTTLAQSCPRWVNFAPPGPGAVQGRRPRAILTTSSRATSCSSTRSTGSARSWRRSSTRRWRTMCSTW